MSWRDGDAVILPSLARRLHRFLLLEEAHCFDSALLYDSMVDAIAINNATSPQGVLVYLLMGWDRMGCSW